MALPEKRLEDMEARFQEVETSLGDPSVAARPDDLKRLGKEHAELRPTIETWRRYKQAQSDLQEAKSMLSGTQGEERSYLLEEIATQEKTLEALGEELS
nr:PCRF domain-containing protein [Actinomycetota bacterium]